MATPPGGGAALGSRADSSIRWSDQIAGNSGAVDNLVIAWRIMLMTLLGRATPSLPSEIMFSHVELRALSAFAKKNG
jgi:hypothetical protein